MHLLQRPLEAASMRLLGHGEGVKPISHLTQKKLSYVQRNSIFKKSLPPRSLQSEQSWPAKQRGDAYQQQISYLYQVRPHHRRVHLGILVRFSNDSAVEILNSIAHRLISARISNL